RFVPIKTDDHLLESVTRNYVVKENSAAAAQEASVTIRRESIPGVFEKYQPNRENCTSLGSLPFT
ncbi:MAG TPA: hypothetical protein VI386_12320, partial [Candidatus Sulfotelmatobacter sp.]